MRQGVTVQGTEDDQSSSEAVTKRASERTGRHLPSVSWPNRRRTRSSPVSGVERGLATLGIVWEGLWLLPDPSLWPTNQVTTVESVLLAGVLVTWAAVVLTAFGPVASRRRRVRAQIVNVCILFAAGGALLHFGPALGSDPSPIMTDWQAGASLVNLACALTGLLLITVVAVPVVLGAALVEVTLLLIDLPSAPTASDRLSTVLYPTYALAMGAASIGARRGLLGAARRSDEARTGLEFAESQAQALRGVQRRMREQQRLLHETVLNTLTAIARGGIGGSADSGMRIRVMCAESSLVLRTLSSAEFAVPATGSRDWAADVMAGIQPLIDLGVHVDLRVQATGRPIPDPVYGAMVVAVREALSNVARHAQADSVVLSVSVTTDLRVGRDHWIVEVRDDGSGFDAQKSSSRFGLNSAIVEAMDDVGGEATVASAVGEGTCVRLTWSASPESRVSVVLGKSATSVNALGAPVLVSFGAFSLLSLILTISDFEFWGVAVAGFMIALACGILLVWFGRAGTLPPALVVGVCIATPLVYRFQQIGLGSGVGTPWTDWSSEAIVALLLIVAGTGPWWGFIAALAAWLLTQGDMLGELIRPGTAVIIAGALFARSVRANDRAYAAAMGQRLKEEASSIGDEVSIRALARRYRTLNESSAIRLLDGIANGRIDASEPEVRAACGLEEHFIRTVMRIDPAAGPLHALASQLASRAHHRGISLDVDIAESSGLRRGELLQLRASANRAISHATAGAPARLSARREKEVLIVRLVVTVAESDQAAFVDGTGGHGISWDADPADGTLILEASYAAAPRSLALIGGVDDQPNAD